MGQPKKLTQKQRQERALLARLRPMEDDLKRIMRALMSTPANQAHTWRWAALEVLRSLQTEPNNEHVERLREKALAVAREAQIVINFV
jgi:hypothetical protein